jgi:hypothetical protein
MNDNAETKPPPGFGYERLFAGQRAQHSFVLYDYISQVLLDRPEVSAIVEIGTSLGALSIYLGLWGARRGIPVHTFDYSLFAFDPQHNVDEITAKPIFDKLGIVMHRADVFSDDGGREVSGLISGAPVLIFCDGGNKPREVQTFAPMVGDGSIVCAHDWPGEIKPEDVASVVEAARLVPWCQDKWNFLATAFWFKG